MKKYLFVLAALCGVLVLSSGAWAWYYDNTNGDTEETAYVIDTVEELKLLRDRVNSGTEKSGKYYVLTKDLDISAETDWEPIGYDAESYYPLQPYRTFNGNFDGKEHTITVKINRNKRDTNSVNVYAGLFGYIDGSISNLNVKGSVQAHAITNVDGVAEAAGIAVETHSATIENCKFSGMVRAVHDGYGNAWAGGIAAKADGIDNEINNCEVSAGSSVYASSDPEDHMSNVTSIAGGIAGTCNLLTSITGCTSNARTIREENGTSSAI